MDNSGYAWLVMIYRLPSEPTRCRAWVWRQVKRLGGVYLQDGVFVVPDLGDMQLEVQALAEQVGNFGGQAQAMVGRGLAPDVDKDLVGRFNAERDAEYRPILAAATRLCDYFQEEESHFDFSAVDLGRLGEQLGRLRRQFRQVRGRDYFSAPLGKEVAERLDECDVRLINR